ncbi:MAG TPA: hypothetical protein VK507_02205 [Iamia sp.]|nr:hypothetical protein [Iamia sp.]
MLTPVEREMVSAAAQAGAAAARQLIPSIISGVIVSTDLTNTIAMVQADGPNEAHGAEIVAPITFRPGDRCKLLYMGDRALCLVIGRGQGDYDDWHVVGAEGEPVFQTGWGHSAGTFPPGQNGPAQVMFTMRSGRVELRGRATRTSGALTTIFPLPEAYWPDNDLLISGQGALGAHVSLGFDYATGMVSVASGAEAVFDGVSYLARIQNPD